jgi:alditol oxidase
VDRNWAGNVEFRAGAVHRPRSVPEVQRLVAGSKRVKAVGTAHSFSRAADTTGDLIYVTDLPPAVEIDPAGPSVTVSAGQRYSDIAPRLHAAGYALASLASLPHLSVAGAVMTGTHGSGDGNQCLAAAVSAMELVSAGGDLITVRREVDPDRLAGLAVSLGACGIVTAVSLDLVPAFSVRQWVCERVPFEAIAGNFAAIAGAAYSVSVFTGWDDDRLDRVWLKCADADPDPPAGWLGGRRAVAGQHPIAGLPPGSATPQGGAPGPWHERLPHFRPEFTPSAGAELQSEFLFDRDDAAAALRALDGVRADLAPVVQVSEIRTVAADELWLSPASGRATVAVHFTWIPDLAAVAPVLTLVEAALAPFAPRPHWGKISTIPAADVVRRYPRMADFRRLAADFDPGSKFRNDYLDGYLSEPAGA